MRKPTVVVIGAALLLAGLAAGAQAGVTPAQTEGPYYKGGSPERDTLYGAMDSGKRIVVTGRVLDRSGRPVAGAWIDVWQADAAGRYDNAGFGYRGHIFADAEGRYAFRTVLPAEYTGRTRHIHVKVRTGQGPVLTTQLYFPEAAASNRRDRIFDEALLVKWDADGITARFDFVLP